MVPVFGTSESSSYISKVWRSQYWRCYTVGYKDEARCPCAHCEGTQGQRK